MTLVTETSHDCCIQLELVRVTVRGEQEQQRVQGSEIEQLERGTYKKKPLDKFYLYSHPTNRLDAFGNVTCAGLGVFRSCNEQQKK